MTFMTGKYFIDTNLFIYLFTKSDLDKKECVYNLLKEHKNVNFVISTQVIKEFTAVMLRKFKIDPFKLKSIIDNMSEFEVVETDVLTIKKAIDIMVINQLSFWDSLIISAAKSANCSVLLSEDMNNGQAIDGVTILNPFE